MREATITIRWVGPDKPVRAAIGDALDALFEDLTEQFEGKITYADSAIKFEATVKSS